ncbi:MFS transporter [Nocardioides cavernaquae]|uniref:MFS transporter n=1 Tax=Nocardioides cavernaquae TaxID=2321396 RepID=UPI0011C37DEE|nr:MFS transporter [Nocardioides cavernaquae]
MAPAPSRLDRRVLLGFAVSAIGNGLTMPFLYVYLAHVRDLGPSTTGWLFAWIGLVGVVVAPALGSLMDRFGPRLVMMCGLGVEVVSVGSLGFVDEIVPVMLALAGLVVGAAPLWPGTTALLALVVAPERREGVYGLVFLAVNAGLGLGGVVGAALIDVSRLGSFQVLYVADACSYLVYAVVLATLPRGVGRTPSGEQCLEGGWREVVADRRVMALLACGVLAVTFGYGQFEAGASAYVVEVAGLPAQVLGWGFAANTLVIVASQLLVLQLTAHRRRTAVLAFAVATWSVAWVVVGLSAAVPGWWAIAAVVIGLGVFGLGETLWAPVATGLVNTLAPAHLRGRYNAALGLVWTLGQVFGPAIAGVLIGHGHGGTWVAVVVGGTLLSALLLASLRRRLTPEEDGLPARRGSQCGPLDERPRHVTKVRQS